MAASERKDDLILRQETADIPKGLNFATLNAPDSRIVTVYLSEDIAIIYQNISPQITVATLRAESNKEITQSLPAKPQYILALSAKEIIVVYQSSAYFYSLDKNLQLIRGKNIPYPLPIETKTKKIISATLSRDKEFCLIAIDCTEECAPLFTKVKKSTQTHQFTLVAVINLIAKNAKWVRVPEEMIYCDVDMRNRSTLALHMSPRNMEKQQDCIYLCDIEASEQKFVPALKTDLTIKQCHTWDKYCIVITESPEESDQEEDEDNDFHQVTLYEFKGSEAVKLRDIGEIKWPDQTNCPALPFPNSFIFEDTTQEYSEQGDNERYEMVEFDFTTMTARPLRQLYSIDNQMLSLFCSLPGDRLAVFLNSELSTSIEICDLASVKNYHDERDQRTAAQICAAIPTMPAAVARLIVSFNSMYSIRLEEHLRNQRAQIAAPSTQPELR
jgi:hypothetical protein